MGSLAWMRLDREENRHGKPRHGRGSPFAMGETRQGSALRQPSTKLPSTENSRSKMPGPSISHLDA